MKAPARLGLYGAGLVAVFAVAFAAAGVVVPEETVQNRAPESSHDDHAGGDEMAADEPDDLGAGEFTPGLALAQGGYRLSGLTAPDVVGRAGELSLTITDSDGTPVTDFELAHDKEMHLIVVRADGQHFRHVHPEMNDEGTWSIPWEWAAAGSYRVFADFLPAQAGDGRTLSSSVQVSGEYDPTPAGLAATTTVDGFDVALEGDLIAGEASELTMTVTREGRPVTELQPYLGAFGHLVALRDGDLAYLHVHPHGDEPQAGETSGPDIVFEATAPTPGRYLLYLDFQIDGQVRTAALVIDTSTSSDTGEGVDSDSGDGPEEGDDHDH